MLSSQKISASEPRLKTPSMVARDITAEFTNAASKLKIGELVKDENFTLFEAVGALEIMDSKMDSGYIGPGEAHAQALEDDYDVRRELQAEEVLGLMDQLLCHEVAWHMGHPLSQTLFTSIYLDRILWPIPNTLDEAHFHRERDHQARLDLERQGPLTHLVLRAYCVALARSCDIVRSRILAEYYYEEEDFVSQLYNRNLLSTIDVADIRSLVDRAIKYLEESGDDIDAQVKQALIRRLRFRDRFLEAVSSTTEIVRTSSKQNFVDALSFIRPIEESTTLGRAVEEAFSVKLQRRLASTLPPRPMVKIKFQDAIAFLRRLCQDAIDMHELFDYSCAYDLRVSLWQIVSRKPPPGVYIRCLLQAYIRNDIQDDGHRLLLDDLSELVMPAHVLLNKENEEAEAPSDPRFQMYQTMDRFLKRVRQPFIDTFRTACLNRSRIRRTLTHTVVEWDTIQMEAEEIDTLLRPLTREIPLVLYDGQPTYSYPLSSWVYNEKLNQIRTILQMGFELSIYAPEELAGIYWYLSHICSTHIAHIDRIRTFVSSDHSKNARPDREPLFDRSLTVLRRYRTQLIATETFSLALHALYAFLDRRGLLPHAASADAYSSPRLRYELRMKPLIPITLPEIVSYDVYEGEATLKGETDAAVLARSRAAIDEAKKAWEAVLAQGPFLPPIEEGILPGVSRPAIEADWQKNVKDSLRACIGASIAIQTVSKVLNNQSSQPPSLAVEIPEVGSTGRWHDWWAVPRISERKK